MLGRQIPHGLAADILTVAADLLQKRGWSSSGDGGATLAAGMADDDGTRHSVYSAIEAACSMTLTDDAWDWPAEQMRNRFAGYLYLTGRVTGDPPSEDLEGMIIRWEIDSRPALTLELAVIALRECSGILEITGLSGSGHLTASAMMATRAALAGTGTLSAIPDVVPEGFFRDDDGALRRQHDLLGGPHDEPPAGS